MLIKIISPKSIKPCRLDSAAKQKIKWILVNVIVIVIIDSYANRLRSWYIYGRTWMCELWCDFYTIVASRWNWALFVQRLWAVSQDERHEPSVSSSAQTIGKLLLLLLFLLFELNQRKIKKCPNQRKYEKLKTKKNLISYRQFHIKWFNSKKKIIQIGDSLIWNCR